MHQEQNTGKNVTLTLNRTESLNQYYTSLSEVLILDKRNDDYPIVQDGDLKRGLPLVYRNSVTYSDKETAVRLLANALGKGTKVSIRHGNFSNPSEYAYSRKNKELTIDDFLNNHFLTGTNEYHYLGNYHLNRQQAVAVKVEKPEVSFKNDLCEGSYWIGRKGCTTPLHCDGPDIFIHQMLGKKRWTLFSPADFQHLYTSAPTPQTHPYFYVSEIDLRMEHKSFPNYKYATPFQMILEAGDSLYLPSSWFHFVETIEDSIMMNFYLNDPNAMPAIFRL